jgi:1-acyl-sn-glycerol-3-phosphate acyltransferase
MKRTIFTTPILNSALQRMSIIILKLAGWRKEGRPPDLPKYVVIAAPHTCGWELPIGLLMAFACRVNAHWLGKDSLFRGPLGPFFKWIGGIPVDRSKPSGMVAQMVEAFNKSERMALILAPEGTRKATSHWRTGFYHIAMGAGVPIVLGYLDFRRKAGGIGPVIMPTGDLNEDMYKIRRFYAGVTPAHPERKRMAAAAA